MNPLQPDAGKVYDHLEAIPFVAMWTGLDADVVGQVLDAKVRYLELAGLAVSSTGGEDETDLQAEREQFHDLLPGTLEVIDERETAYLVLVTGLTEKTVLRVGQGEMAYLDSLGLVDWDSEAERDAALGNPNIPEGEAAEPPIYELHGNQWSCLVPDFNTIIKRYFSGEPDRPNLQFKVPSPLPRWDDITAYATPEAANLATWRIDGNRTHRHDILNAFPVAKDGTIHTLTPSRARIWEYGCEATRYATLESGLTLAFYDTCHLHPLNSYPKGIPVEVRLSGFCFSLKRPPKGHGTNDKRRVQLMRAFQDGIRLDQVTDLSSFTVDPGKTSFLLPRSKGNPDEYLFQGPVVDVDVLEAWDHLLYRLEVILFHHPVGGKKTPFIVTFYVAKNRVPTGYTPHVGDFICGFLWLQGIRHDLPLPWPTFSDFMK